MPEDALHSVLVPGLACSARLYEPLLADTWAYGAVTIADSRRDDSIEGMAQRLLAHAPQRFTLVGVSMGGYVALEVMRRAPHRVRAAALISTSARPDTPEQADGRRRQIATTRAGGFDDLVAASFPVLVDDNNRQDTALAAVWTQMAHEVGPEAFCTQLRAAIGREDARPTLAGIACPTAVVHGAGDRLVPIEHGQEMAAAIPGAVLTIIDGAGHMAVQEEPAAAAAALRDLLARAKAA
jgi:pimeloyl-ACP methyl ester carboxylesterase